MAKAATVAVANKDRTRHPPYFEMIRAAILTLKERKGSSQQAIAKSIEEKHKKVLPSKFKKSLSVQLNKFVKSERLFKVNNSFKLSSANNPKLGPKLTHKTKKAKKIAEKPMKRKKARKLEVI